MADGPADDYYETLQISPNADPDTVHRVYRLLAQRFHPDNKETGSDVRFQGPSGAKLDAVFEMGRDEAAVIFPETKETGFYRVLAGEKLVGSVAVNVDPRESNLESLSMTQMRTLSEISRDRLFAAAGLDVQALRNLRVGRPLWHYCLVAALCLLALEQALTLIWRK